MFSVNLHPIDCSYDDFEKLPSFESPFISSDLDFAGEKQKVVKKIVKSFEKKSQDLEFNFD